MNMGEIMVEDKVNFGTFIDYRKVILTLSSDLRQLQKYAQDLELTDSAHLIEDVLHRIEEDRFTVAVVGEFKRGKSTFLNALLGMEILPTDILPCSATLNRVTYGLKEMAKIHFHDGRSEIIALDDLANYVTKTTEQSEEIAKTVKEATVYYPCPYCQNNVDVIDTPGLNDDANMTDVTLSVLPQTDAAILVMIPQGPLSEYERNFLEGRLLTSDLGRVIFVVNRIDDLRPQDADRIIKHIEDQLKKKVMERAAAQYGQDSPEYEMYLKKIGRPRVFGLSASQALAGKSGNDYELLTKSRFPEFEKELQRFLTEHRGAVTLQVPVNRAITAGNEILQAMALREGALSLKKEEFEHAYAESMNEIEQLQARKAEELKKIREAADEVRRRMLPMADRIPEQLRQVAAKTIDDAPIAQEELKNTKQLTEKLGNLIATQVRLASETESQRIQGELERALLGELERLSDFENSVGELMSRMNLQFTNIQTKFGQSGGSGEAWAAAIAVITGYGGIWSGYRVAGAKGAMLGAATSIGTFFAAGAICALLTLPISWPALIAIGIASIFPSQWVTQWVFGGTQIERFRETFKEEALKQLDDSLRAGNVRTMVNEQISMAFEALRSKVEAEVDAVLRDAEQTLVSVRTRRERDIVLSETERAELREMQETIQAITGNAQRLSHQLVEIMTV